MFVLVLYISTTVTKKLKQQEFKQCLKVNKILLFCAVQCNI